MVFRATILRFATVWNCVNRFMNNFELSSLYFKCTDCYPYFELIVATLHYRLIETGASSSLIFTYYVIKICASLRSGDEILAFKYDEQFAVSLE